VEGERGEEMKAFLWHNIDVVSNCFHSDGSVLIVAETVERARELGVLTESDYNFETKETTTKTIKMTIDRDPDAVFNANELEEKVFVFPNAGCCC
jgi:hypothetical protein